MNEVYLHPKGVSIIYIETPRMIIRDFTPGDAADLHEIFGDDETMENCEPAYDYEKTKEFLLNAHKVFAEAIDAKKSVALMQKLGMKLEGVQRSQTKDNQMLGG